MQNKWLAPFLVSGLLVGAAGCPDVNVDPGEGVNDTPASGPIVEFDPSNKIIPFPNNLLLDPTTGKVNLPEQCGESATSKATREQVLNKLDGFGTYQVGMRVTFNEPVDETSLAGKVVLYKRASVSGATVTPADPFTAMPVPTLLRKGTTTRFTLDCASSSQIDSLTIVPLVPLDQKSIYTVALLAGVKTADGDDYGASFTWSLIRQAEDPVTLADPTCNPGTGTCVIASDRTPLDPGNPVDDDMDGIGDDLESLNGIDLLWKAHSTGVAFLETKGHARSDLLLAWDFKTQTVTDPLDPTVAGSPASMVLTGPLVGISSLTCDFDATTCPRGINRGAQPYSQCTDPATAAGNTQCYLKIALGVVAGASGLAIYPTGQAVCASLGSPSPCLAVGDVVAGGLVSRNYQLDLPAVVPAPTTGPNVGNPNFGGPIPGPWSDPINPAFQKNTIIQVLAIIPAAAGPHATVVFGHGFTSSKKAVFAIGAQLAGAGFASVTIDLGGHDTRAVRISTDAAAGCADVGGAAPDPGGGTDTRTTACYAPFLSANLGTTRDGLRQTVLDLQGLVAGLKGCGATGCAPLAVDTAHIVYAGQSLGGIVGSMVTATQSDIKAAALNVPGVGWGDIFENTERNDFRCPLVDALIDSGLLTGAKSSTTGTTAPRLQITGGLCTTPAWTMQPGYATFAATARWVLDPADPANFTRKLAARKFLIQEVVGDTVVPNVATDREAALVGLTSVDADKYFPNCAGGGRAGLGCGSDAQCPASTCTFPSASASVLTNITANKFVKHAPLAPDGPTLFAGNSYWHGSLLKPLGSCSVATTQRCSSTLQCPGTETCDTSNDGSLGTARLQKDAITYLFLNK